MDWTSFLTSFFSTLIGASAALAGIYIENKNEHKKSIKIWFENKYIDSIDGLIEFFTYLKLYYLEQSTQTGQVTQKPKVPIGCIANLESILPDSGIDVIVMFFHAGPRNMTDKTALKSFIDSCVTINNKLGLLREKLLSVNLKEKRDVYLLKHNKEISKDLATIKSILQQVAKA